MLGREGQMQPNEVQEPRDSIERLALANTITTKARAIKHKTNLCISNGHDKTLCF
jgi:hypothetical protein